MPTPDDIAAALIANSRPRAPDDPLAGWAPDYRAAPYMPGPTTGRTIQQILDEEAAKQQAFQPVKPTIPQQLGDIAGKTAQMLGAPIAAAKNLTERAMSGERTSDNPEAIRQAADVAMNVVGAGAGSAKPGALGMGGGKLVQPTMAAGGEAAPFFSGVGEAVSKAKLAKAPVEQWANYLKGQPGVKAEELQQLGLTPGHPDAPAGSLTKDQMAEHVANNQLQVKEVQKGDDPLRGLSRESLAHIPPEDIASISRKAQPKYASYQLPGGQNYGETLITLPSKSQVSEKYAAIKKQYDEKGTFSSPEDREYFLSNSKGQAPGEGEMYRSSHWDEPNVLVHIRHNDRDVPGVGNALHLEEVQSDWHQAGRKSGYKGEETKGWTAGPGADHSGWDIRLPNGELRYRLNKDEASTPEEAIKTASEQLDNSKNPTRVPDAPFKDTWPDLGLKRMLYKAATETDPATGAPKYHALSWTPGDAQAARYDLSKQLDHVKAYKQDDGTWRLAGMPKGGNQRDIVHLGNDIPTEKLSDYVGKDLAEKIAAQGESEKIYEGQNLKVGGEGMKQFYDKMLVDKANALGKKYGARVNQIGEGNEPNTFFVKDGELNGEEGVGAENTMGDQLDDGHYYFKDEMDENGQGPFPTREAALKAGAQPKLHVLPITPELRAAAAKGFPLFALGAAAAGPALNATRPLPDKAAEVLAKGPPKP